MRTLFIPLDERPCNRVFPSMVASTADDVELVEPDLDILGDKKRPANLGVLEDFMLRAATGCDAAIVSLDMLLYGGLIPSRIHHLDRETVLARFEVLRRMKRENPRLKVYAFQCIMRTPRYDSGEEEPDYYETYGYRLFRRKYLLDYQERHGELSAEDAAELAGIDIPSDILVDYEARRDFNLDMNLEALGYLKEGTIDFLVIPQDDAAPYGYTAIAQKRVIRELKAEGLGGQVMIYPGADEVGMSLMARAYVEQMGKSPAIYPFYASVLGPTIVPNYEDRPMFESLKAHVRVCGAHLVQSAEAADIVLAINCPGSFMQEAVIQRAEPDVTYTSYRQLLDFELVIKEHVDAGRRVALCDSAFSNGGDVELVRALDELGVLDKLVSYAGWNTNCNTLGTTLAQVIMGTSDLVRNVCYRVIEDTFYQPLVRDEVVREELPSRGLSYYDFKDRQADVEDVIRGKLQALYDGLKIAREHPVDIKRIYMPWRRMFEIGMEMEMISR